MVDNGRRQLMKRVDVKANNTERLSVVESRPCACVLELAVVRSNYVSRSGKQCLSNDARESEGLLQWSDHGFCCYVGFWERDVELALGGYRKELLVEQGMHPANDTSSHWHNREI